MMKEQAEFIIKALTRKSIHFESGLADDEVLQIEGKFNLTFPPDLKLFLQSALPTSESFVNWRLGLKSQEEADKIMSRLDWPLEGMLFDIESNNFWVESWGAKPNNLDEKNLIAKQYYKTYPKLIPIYSHRYIPSRPSESYNPVFSVYQMDIIYYGYNLVTYLANEFHFALPKGIERLKQPKKKIEFWSEWT
jgi:hypothetical protein